MSKRINKVTNFVIDVLASASIIAVYAAICALAVKFFIWTIT